MHPPPSGRHAMRSLYVIGRDGWVWDMSNTQWLEMDSSHEVGECSVTVVWHRAGVYSDRPCHEIVVVVVAPRATPLQLLRGGGARRGTRRETPRTTTTLINPLGAEGERTEAAFQMT